MTQKKISEKRIYDFFIELNSRCRQKKAYSAIETASKMGVDPITIKEWTAQKEGWRAMWQGCREICAGNAEIDSLLFKLPAEEAFKYMLEGDDEFSAYYPTPEAQEELLRSAREDK